MVSPIQLLKFYINRLLKRVELYLLLGGFIVFLTATQTSHHDPVIEHSANGYFRNGYFRNGSSPKTAPQIDSLIKYALSFQGVPYRYGGKNTQGFDCSGFTCYVFREFDINLNASSYRQFIQGQAIAADSIQKADLVFFRNTKNKINHVGIITEASPEQTLFVHASSSQGIKVDVLESPYYKKRLAGFRRIIF